MTHSCGAPLNLLVAGALFASVAQAATDGGCGGWVWANPRPWGPPVTTVIGAGDRFFAYGPAGVHVSLDGETWIEGGEAPAWTKVLATGDSLVAVTDFTIGTSQDGVHWTIRFQQEPDPRGSELYDLAWNGQVFVAVGFVSTESSGGFGYSWILTSRDGVSWRQVRAPQLSVRDAPLAVVWTGTQFVAVGTDVNGHGLVLRSPDAETWTAQLGPAAWSVATNGETIVAVGPDSAWRSNDGFAWEEVALPHGGTARVVRWIGSQFVAVGRGGLIAVSPDGVGWTVHESGTTDDLWSVARVGAVLVAAGDTILSRQGGGKWLPRISRQIDPGISLRGGAWGGGRYAIAGRAVGQPAVVLRSTNAVQWEVGHTDINVTFNALVWGGGLWVAVGDDGKVATSSDALSWEERGSGTSDDLVDVVWGSDKFVAVGDGGSVLASPDGLTWSSQPSPTSQPLRAVAWGDDQFVAVGGGRGAGSGLLLTSSDGSLWTVRDYPRHVPLVDVAWGGGRFVTVGGYATYVSENGTVWQEAPTLAPAFQVAWFGGRFYAAGAGWVASSADGMVWTQEGTGGAGALVAGERLLEIGPGSNLRWRLCGAGAGPVYLPGIAHVEGRNGSRWRSDVEVHNPTGAAADVTVELLSRDEENLQTESHTVTLAGSSSRRTRDVLVQSFGRSGAGTLRVSSSSGRVLATARTYNDAPTGSYGQSVPGLPLAEALKPGEVGMLLGLAQSADGSSGFRTNLGLVNAVAWPLEVEVELFADDGRRLGSSRYTLRALESIQVDGSLQPYAAKGELNGFALVRSSTSGARFFAYASVVDNATGDATTVLEARRQSPACTPWEGGFPPVGDTLFDVVAGDGEFVAVGSAGTIVASIDGRQWELRSSGTTAGLQSLAWSGSTYVAVGSDGTVVTSRNGHDWAVRRSGTGDYLRGVTWTGANFVAVGWGGLILTSTDGTVWQEQRLPNRSFDDVASDGHRTVVVGDTTVVSDDLSTWEDRGAPWWEGGYDTIWRVIWTGSAFLGVGSGPLYRSPDGLSWVAVDGTAFLNLADVASVDRELVGVSYQGIGTSPTGEVWTMTPAPEDSDLVALAWDGRVAVAVGFDGIAVRRECGLAAAPVSVPGAAHLAGWGKSRWRTDLVVHNPSDRLVGFSLSLLERGTMPEDPPTRSFQLGPGVSARYPDVLGDQFQFEGAATLRLVPLSGEVIAQSRTYDGSSGATYGASIAGLVEDRAIAQGETARLIQLSESASFRTNLGLVSVVDTPIQVEIELFRADGSLLGSRSVELRPRESIQVDRIFATVTAEEVEDGYAVVTSASDGATYFAYASVVDASTNDPITVLARRTTR